jgi:hypothetical protein
LPAAVLALLVEPAVAAEVAALVLRLPQVALLVVPVTATGSSVCWDLMPVRAR